MTSYPHYQNDPSYLFDVPSDDKTCLFLFEYNNYRRGIYSVKGSDIESSVGAFGIDVNKTPSAPGDHCLYVANNKVYFNSFSPFTVKYKILIVL